MFTIETIFKSKLSIKSGRRTSHISGQRGFINIPWRDVYFDRLNEILKKRRAFRADYVMKQNKGSIVR